MSAPLVILFLISLRFNSLSLQRRRASPKAKPLDPRQVHSRETIKGQTKRSCHAFPDQPLHRSGFSRPADRRSRSSAPRPFDNSPDLLYLSSYYQRRRQLDKGIIRTTGVAGGLYRPCKGLLPAALIELEEVRQSHHFPGQPLKGLPGILFVCWQCLARKRIYRLKQA